MTTAHAVSESVITGSCLCGKIAYEYSGSVKTFQYCHCSRCQKITGAAHAANIIVAPEQFRWTQGEHLVGRFELPEAKHFATGFCTCCGSSLPWLSKSHRSMIIPAGTLNDNPGIKPAQSIFYASRACWYESVDTLPKHDELPPR